MTLIYTCLLICPSLGYHDKWAIIGKDLVQSYFWVNFGTSVLSNSYDRLKYVFEKVVSVMYMYFLNVNINVSINDYSFKYIGAVYYLKPRFYCVTCSVTYFRDFNS